MRVVFDTSPICYLVLIGEIDVLPSLFEEILVPHAVVAEWDHPKSPLILRRWAAEPPGWLRRHSIDVGKMAGLRSLDRGEREAIALARLSKADLVVLDDKAARRIAFDLGLSVTGLLGVLDRAAAQGLLDLRAAVGRLRKTSFRAHPRLLKDLLDRHS